MSSFDPNAPISFDKPTARLDPPAPVTAVLPYAFGPATAPVQGPPPTYAPAPYAPPVPTYGHAMSTTTVRQQSNAEIIVAWVFTALTLLYMLPWAIAATRRSTNSVLIAIATFFLAWTFIGWLVLLVLAFLGPTTTTVMTTSTVHFGAVPPAPPQLGTWAHCPTDPPHVRRWWDGHAWTAHTTVG